MELLTLNVICTLVEKFYPQNFTRDDINALKRQLRHYKLDVLCQLQFQNIASLSELCCSLVQNKRSQHYFLIDRLLCLVLTLYTSIRNKMEQEFLTNSMFIYTEREIADAIDSDIVIDKNINYILHCYNYIIDLI
ncbi:hypothetical protein ACOSQ4_024139 [Xanthoceras sorbifolium]